ncbi:MAG TPA: PKD domain-containing protein [Bacteroidia bacterium]|nr:PKD domain-containing protein [Bacteroidia bacterium]
MRLIFRNILFIILLIGGSTLSVAAQCMQEPVSLTSRISQADLIVEGKVTQSNSFWNVQQTLIYTEYTIDVGRVFKGNYSSQNINIITEGGEVGLNKLVVNPSLTLQIGEVGLFFLEAKTNTGEFSTLRAFNYFPVALNQGFIEYSLDHSSASDLFNSYANIQVQLFDQIISQTGMQPTFVSSLTPNSVKGNNSNTPQMPPSVVAIIPPSQPAGLLAGSQITITGNGFTTNTGPALLEFSNANDGGATFIACPANHIVAWANTTIIVWVPSGAGSGPVRITDNTGATVTSAVSLTVPFNESNVISGLTYYQPDLISDNGVGGYTYVYNSTFNANAPAVAAFERALSTWRCGTFVNFHRLTPMVPVALSVQGLDNVNLVTFDGSSPLPAGVLGVSYSFYSSCGSGVWYLNENDLKFRTNGTGGINWQYGPALAAGALYDFESVCLHELGHSHQLGHTIISPTPSVMHWAIGPATNRRALQPASEIAGGNDIMSRSTVANICGPSQMIAVNSSNCQIAAPIAEFSGTPTVGCNSLTVNFTNLSTGNPTSWTWAFPGGVPAAFVGANPPPVNYAAPGSYTVTLTVTNAFGTDIESKTNYIVVNSCPPPVANFMANDTILCEGQSIQFTDLSTNIPTSWSWNFPGGTPVASIAQNPIVTYNTAGTYNVTLTAANANGSNILTKNLYIKVNVCPPPPVADFSASPTTVCINQTINFTNLTTGQVNNYQWSFPGGVPATSFAINPTVSYPVAGVYTVSLTANGNGGSHTATKVNYIIVNTCAPPVADFGGAPTQICAGQTVNFTDLSTNTPTGWSWTFTGGVPAASIAQNPTGILYALPGAYNVSLTATNALGSGNLTRNAYITVVSCPSPGSGLVVNDGSYIHVQPGTNIFVDGGVINQDNFLGMGTIENLGTIEIKGDWTNNSSTNAFLNSGPGLFLMSGAAQGIRGSTPTYFYNLTLGGTSVKTQYVNAQVQGTLALTDRELATQTNDMYVTNTFAGAITRTGLNTSTGLGMVSSMAGGSLMRNLNSAGIYEFPVGSSNPPYRFRPVRLQPNSTSAQTMAVRFVNYDPNFDAFDRNLRDPSLGNVNPLWYVKIERISGTSSNNITLTYDFIADNVMSYGNLLLTEWGYSTPYLWKDLGAVTFGMAASPNLATVTKNAWSTYDTENFSMATMSSPLPVQLLNFNAICDEPGVVLKWSTASETNSAYFEIEKSIGSGKFKSIGQVVAAGNSSWKNDYQFIDENTSEEKSYYRLHQYDLDGNSVAYGPIASHCKEGFTYNIYPNPTTSSSYIQLISSSNTKVLFKLYDNIGRVILNKEVEINMGANLIELNLNHLNAGYYYLQALDGVILFTEPISVLK